MVATERFDSRVAGPAIPTPPTTPPPSPPVAGVVANRRRDAHHANPALLLPDRAAALAHRRERLLEPIGRRDGLRRARRKTCRQHLIHHLGRSECENGLALGRAIRGLAH